MSDLNFRKKWIDGDYEPENKPDDDFINLDELFFGSIEWPKVSPAEPTPKRWKEKLGGTFTDDRIPPFFERERKEIEKIETAHHRYSRTPARLDSFGIELKSTGKIKLALRHLDKLEKEIKEKNHGT